MTDLSDSIFDLRIPENISITASDLESPSFSKFQHRSPHITSPSHHPPTAASSDMPYIRQAPQPRPLENLNYLERQANLQSNFYEARAPSNGGHEGNGGPGRGNRYNRPPVGGDDVLRFQFWPTAVAMGSLVGKQFVQMLGARCEFGEDLSREGQDGFKKGHGRSYLAFDFQRALLVIKANLDLDRQFLPPALRPLDAELAFDDIASQGIHIVAKPRPPRMIKRAGDQGGSAAPPEQEVTVTVSCRRPPRFYSEFEQNDELYGEGSGGWKRGSKVPYRRRATAMDFAIAGVCERDAGPIETIPEGPCAYPTFWNAYRWTFILPPHHVDRLRQCTLKLRALAEADPDLDLVASAKPRWEIVKLDARSFAQMYRVDRDVLDNVRFGTRTLIEGLIAHGILRPGDVRAMLQALKENAVVPAFQERILESLYNEERIRDVAKLVRAKARYLRTSEPTHFSHLVMIRTVLVTPTRVLVGPPAQEPSNSVTRRYSDKLDGIIRVQFADEENRLWVQEYTKQADQIMPEVGIMARVRRALQHGLKIGGRRFMPVASSASQQKDHAMWFIDTKMIDGFELRKWMGSVDETIVAKHSARMGLPFSTSRIVELDIRVREDLPDIKRNGYCFTDGVGVAGREVMRQAARALGTTSGINACPSTIQFRLGGAKGVLSCWPNMVDDEHEVRLRPSLVKFKSSLCDLNVVRLAKYQVAFLNRQFIMIMCANGVPESLMIEIFQEAVRSIKDLKARVKRGGNAITKDDYNLMSLCSDFPLTALIKAGFNRDPLVLDIVEIIECRALQDLKWRARVKLPTGVFLIGIADESGTLREGEVFCQFQETEEDRPKIVTSEVLVCRAPALHPGDVRRVFAVDRPELRHLKNVIVFSTQGQRDLPNMLGGGDLDGDDYTLIWDQRFVQTLRVHPPMDYTGPEPVRVDKVTQAHLNENFVQYMLNDVLGQVDNYHIALSDQESPFAPGPMALSLLHSTAVDFAKTGVAAVLDPNLRPKSWPDFLDRPDVRNVYESQKILGQLFRIVQPDPHFRPSDIRQLGYPTDPRIAKYPIFESLLRRLRPIKAQYESDLTYDLRRYRVCEPEIPSGIAIRNKRRKRARDQNLNEPLRDAYNAHIIRTRDLAHSALRGIEFRSKLTEMQVVARHAYALTFEKEHVEKWEETMKAYGEGRTGGSEDEDEEVDDELLRPRPMTSFAWVFWQELIQLASMGGGLL